MQHIKAIEKPQEFLVCKIQLLGKEAPSKKTNERQFGGLKESKHFKGNKKGA